MKKHHFLFLALVLFANHLRGADDPPALYYNWFDFVSITPSNVVFKCNRGGVFIYGPYLKEYQLEHHKQFKDDYQDSWSLKNKHVNTEFTIPLDKEVFFFRWVAC